MDRCDLLSANVGFDDFHGASEPGSFQISFFVSNRRRSRRRILGLARTSAGSSSPRFKQMQLRTSTLPFTGLTEEFAFEKSKFFTQLLDRLLSVAVRLSQASTFNLKTLCKSIISSVQPCG